MGPLGEMLRLSGTTMTQGRRHVIETPLLFGEVFFCGFVREPVFFRQLAFDAAWL
jgi:hypothetical protein